jgi:hypothetical protein
MKMRRRWRRTRAVAMTEFLVVLPMLVLLWAGVDYFRQGFARRLETMSQSHAEAWEKAYSNDGTCFGGAKPWDGFTKSSGSMPSGITDKSDSSIFKYNVARSSKSMALTSSRWSGNVVSSTTVTCNEVVPKDDRDVLKPMIDFIKSVL